MPKELSTKDILSYLHTHPNRVVSISLLAEALQVPPHLRRELQHLMRQLAKEKKVTQINPRKYIFESSSPSFKEAIKANGKSSFEAEIESILANSKVSREFSALSEIAAQEMGVEPGEKDKKNRKDITLLPLCTIDGETAKDFDDAVFAKEEKEGLKVIVAIADVSHYVVPNGPLDREAYDRGTSIYYPGKCIPMLPEALSNGLCSLKPHVPRLCMVAEMLISPKGTLKKTLFYDAVMQSAARLTYKEVQQFLDAPLQSKHPLINPALANSLLSLQKASLFLRKARSKRGAIDFDATESHIALDDQGEPVSIRPEERLNSHRLIEDLMIAANEAVAQFLEKKSMPTLFRIHEEPKADKLSQFTLLAQQVGALSPKEGKEIISDPSPKNLSKLLHRIETHSAHAALNALLLRSMMQAKYSAYNVGHFGLASESYLHFTSPIRRYPDLVVHRQLKKCLLKKKLSEAAKEKELEKLDQIAEHSSECERKATEIERAMDALFSAWYMKDKVGEKDIGVITSVAEFGLFLRLKTFHTEGLLHISNLKDGYYEFDSKHLQLINRSSKRRFSLGDELEVRVSNVNVNKRFIDLDLVTAATSKKKNPSPRRKGPKRHQAR